MKEKNLNIPNTLAFIRLSMVPPVIYLILEGQMLFALGVFIVACLTDLLDGYIARKYNMVTRLGTWLDPLADKLMAVSVIITLTWLGVFPVFVPVVMFIKEFLMLTGGYLVLKNGFATPANIFGKIAALVLNAAIGTGFLYKWCHPYYLWLTYAALVLSILAFFQYAVKNRRLMFPKKA